MAATDSHPAIPAIRQASREMVRELGFLTGHVASSDLTFARCHALLELERAGALTAGELAAIINVDRSCASRTLQQLVQAGLAQNCTDNADARRKPVTLTTAGRRQLRAVHEQANRQVASALELLDDTGRATVSEGLRLYAQALRRSRLQAAYRIRPIRRADEPAVAAIIRRVMTEHGASGEGFSIMDPEVDHMHAAYRGPRAGFSVVEHIATGRLAGVAGFARLAGSDDPTICELRKMYYLPELRGLGLGARMMQLVLADAAAAGFDTCYLETLNSMHRARRLYEAFGFRPLPGPLGCTGHTRCDSWYSLDLREHPAHVPLRTSKTKAKKRMKKPR
ncbi:MAG: GNAT family N-acetyltransferase [Planctomycetota bacterium]